MLKINGLSNFKNVYFGKMTEDQAKALTKGQEIIHDNVQQAYTVIKRYKQEDPDITLRTPNAMEWTLPIKSICDNFSLSGQE